MSFNPNSSIESLFSIDSIVRPTLQRLGVATVTQLAQLDPLRLKRTRGIGRHKLRIMTRLIDEARSLLDNGAPIGSNDDSRIVGNCDAATRTTLTKLGIKTDYALACLNIAPLPKNGGRSAPTLSKTMREDLVALARS